MKERMAKTQNGRVRGRVLKGLEEYSKSLVIVLCRDIDIACLQIPYGFCMGRRVHAGSFLLWGAEDPS
jgi:hypothetical protein